MAFIVVFIFASDNPKFLVDNKEDNQKQMSHPLQTTPKLQIILTSA